MKIGNKFAALAAMIMVMSGAQSFAQKFDQGRVIAGDRAILDIATGSRRRTPWSPTGCKTCCRR